MAERKVTVSVQVKTIADTNALNLTKGILVDVHRHADVATAAISNLNRTLAEGSLRATAALNQQVQALQKLAEAQGKLGTFRAGPPPGGGAMSTSVFPNVLAANLTAQMAQPRLPFEVTRPTAARVSEAGVSDADELGITQQQIKERAKQIAAEANQNIEDENKIRAKTRAFISEFNARLKERFKAEGIGGEATIGRATPGQLASILRGMPEHADVHGYLFRPRGEEGISEEEERDRLNKTIAKVTEIVGRGHAGFRNRSMVSAEDVHHAASQELIQARQDVGEFDIGALEAAGGGGGGKPPSQVLPGMEEPEDDGGRQSYRRMARRDLGKYLGTRGITGSELGLINPPVHPMAAAMSARPEVHPMAAAMGAAGVELARTRKEGEAADFAEFQKHQQVRIYYIKQEQAELERSKRIAQEFHHQEFMRTGSPTHMQAIRDSIQQRKDQATRERLETRVGREDQFGKMGAGLLGVADKLDTFGKMSARAFLVSAGAIAAFVRAASPETFGTLTGSIGMLSAEIGRAFVPSIMTAVTWVQRAALWVRSLDPDIKQNIATWTMWGLGITGVGLVLGRLAPVIRTVVSGLTFLTAHPIVASFVAIAAATGVLQSSLSALGPVAIGAGQHIANIGIQNIALAGGIGYLAMKWQIFGAAAVSGAAVARSAMYQLGAAVAHPLTALTTLLQTPWGTFAAAGIGALAILTRGFGLFGQSIDDVHNRMLRGFSGPQGLQGIAQQAAQGRPLSAAQQMTALLSLGAEEGGNVWSVLQGRAGTPQFQQTLQMIRPQLQARVGPQAEAEHQMFSATVGDILQRQGDSFWRAGTAAQMRRRILLAGGANFQGETAARYRAMVEGMYQENILGSGMFTGGMTPERIQAIQQLIINRPTVAAAQLSAVNQLIAGGGAQLPQPGPMMIGGRPVPQGVQAAGQAIMTPAMQFSMQPRQIEIDALHDIVQNESIRSDLDQIRFEQQMESFQTMIQHLETISRWARENNLSQMTVMQAFNQGMGP